MSQEIETFFVPSSSDVDIQEPNRKSRISYTREFLLSLANADSHITVKLPQDVQLSISCLFHDSTGLLSPPTPTCVPDSRCQNTMPQKVSLKVPDDVNLLHRSNEPYRPPRLHKALPPPSTRDSNDFLNGGTFGSSECTNKEKTEGERWRKDSMKENMSSPDVKIHELELNSSTSSELSNFSSELCLPDEDSLITFDESFLMPEVDNSAVNDSYLSEADLFSPSSPRDRFEKLVEFILDDESSPDPYLDDPLMPHGAGLDGFCLSMYARQPYKQFCSNQLNPERDQQDHNSFKKISIEQTMFSLFSDSYPLNRMYQPFPVSRDDELMRKFDHKASQPMFQQKINPGKLHFGSQSVVVPSQLLELKMAFCTQKLNSMQNCLGQEQSYGGFRRQNPDSHGNGGINQAVVDRFVDMKLRASHWHPFVRGF